MNTINQESIRDKIRALGISQRELAEKSGVAQPSISKFLRGKSITIASLEKLWPILYGETPRQQASGE